MITINDKEYPEELFNYSDSPSLLYCLTDKDLNLNKLDRKRVAIVGSRDASKEALKIAYQFGYELAKQGAIIVSGMARGIDSMAHRGALDANGITVAVLGNGLHSVYPKENESLMKEIKKSGIVFSEYENDMPPLKQNFPKRNRIISGLADFVLVIEAKERSGSLITARIALDYGVDVGVIPSTIDNDYSKGSNLLLRDGAYPILEVNDILELL